MQYHKSAFLNQCCVIVSPQNNNLPGDATNSEENTTYMDEFFKKVNETTSCSKLNLYRHNICLHWNGVMMVGYCSDCVK